MYIALFTDYGFVKITSCASNGVCHLMSRSGHYKIKYSNAKEKCNLNGLAIATKTQLMAAFNAGYAVCACGWLSGGISFYPTQIARPGCGVKGLNNCGNDPNTARDVYCYDAARGR